MKDKKIALEEIQNIEFQILCNFHDFCKKHKLKYWLAWGTLLGAVRHQGFIPWDDDIDVVMPMQDYRKMLKILRNGTQIDKNYMFVSPEFSAYATVPWGKIVDKRYLAFQECVVDTSEVPERGLWIDVFPIYTVSSNPILKWGYDMVENLANILRGLMERLYWRPRPARSILGKLFKKPLVIIGKIVGAHRVSRFAERLIVNRYFNFNPRQGKYVYEAWLKGDKLDCPQAYNRTTMLEFNGCFFPVAMDYKKVLLSCFGETYMELPPLELRATHPMKVYYTEKFSGE